MKIGHTEKKKTLENPFLSIKAIVSCYIRLFPVLHYFLKNSTIHLPPHLSLYVSLQNQLQRLQLEFTVPNKDNNEVNQGFVTAIKTE